MKAIRVVINPNDPRLSVYEVGEGVIIGYIKKGDYYTTEILQYLGMEVTTPVESKFEVFIIKRLDKDSAVIVQRSDLGNLIIVKDVNDYNYVQEIYQKGSFFDPSLAGAKRKKNEEKQRKLKKEKLQTVSSQKKKRVSKQKSLFSKLREIFSWKKQKRKERTRGRAKLASTGSSEAVEEQTV